MPLLTANQHGLYCPAADLYIDPWQPVDRAIVTHAHADHARAGSRKYFAARAGEHILRMRLGDSAEIQFSGYGEPITINGVRISLHPASHMTGSAQVRLEHRGEIAVVSGDYKRETDPTCAPFEPIRCHTFVTESTFGLPIYRWPEPQQVFEEINSWWRHNQQAGLASVLFAYTVGKAQRLLSGIDTSIGPVFAHGAIRKAVSAYQADGVPLPNPGDVLEEAESFDWSQALVLAPPSARGSTWIRRFGKVSTGMASGWMRVRGMRRRRSIDRGFVLSDHVDWPGLMATVKETETKFVIVTHGYSEQVVQHLLGQGIEATTFNTQFVGEFDDTDATTAADAP